MINFRIIYILLSLSDNDNISDAELLERLNIATWEINSQIQQGDNLKY